MTPTTVEILNAIEMLPVDEQHQLMLEFLRRVTPVSLNALLDEDLVQCAESIFLDLDRQEAEYEHV